MASISKLDAGIGAAGAAVFDVTVNGGQTLLTLSDMLLPAISVAYSSLAGQLGWLSQEALSVPLAIVALLFIANQVRKAVARYRDSTS